MFLFLQNQIFVFLDVGSYHRSYHGTWDSNGFGFYRNIEDWRTRMFCASSNVSQVDKLLQY